MTNPLANMTRACSLLATSSDAISREAAATVAATRDSISELQGAAAPLPFLFEPVDGGAMPAAVLARAEAAARRLSEMERELADALAAMRACLFAIHKAGT